MAPDPTSAFAADPAGSFTDQASGYHDDRFASFAELATEFAGETDTPASDTPDAGRSPADGRSDAGDGTGADAPETPPIPAGTPETPAAGDPGESADEAPDAETLLASATPFTYTVDGTSKTMDGVRVIPGHGGIIDEAAIPRLQDVIQKGEKAWSDNAQLYAKTQEFERLAYQDVAGQQATGIAAFQAAMVDVAKLRAVAELMASALESPDKIVELVTDPNALQRLQREMALTVREKGYAATQQFVQSRQERVQRESQTATTAQQTTTAIHDSVQQWAAQFPSLTREDQQEAATYLQSMASALVRPATPEEASALRLTPGTLVIDHPKIHAYLGSLAKRADQVQQAAKTAQQAATENAKRLAATKIPARGKVRAAAPVPEAPAKPLSKEEQWRRQKLAMLGGNHSTARDDDE